MVNHHFWSFLEHQHYKEHSDEDEALLATLPSRKILCHFSIYLFWLWKPKVVSRHFWTLHKTLIYHLHQPTLSSSQFKNLITLSLLPYQKPNIFLSTTTCGCVIMLKGVRSKNQINHLTTIRSIIVFTLLIIIILLSLDGEQDHEENRNLQVSNAHWAIKLWWSSDPWKQ